MDLTFDVYVCVNDANNYDKKCFEIDYDPTLKDFNDFAKSEGYKDIEDLFIQNFDEDDEGEVEYVKQALKEHKYYRLESELSYVNYEDQFKQFLENKYESQFVNQLPYCLTISDCAHFEFNDED